MSRLVARWAVAAAMVAAGTTVIAAPSAQAGIIPVTANCTLNDAIRAANADAATAGCPAGSGADTIELPSGATITLSFVDDTSDDAGPNGLPVVTSTIVIDGNGSTIARGSVGTPAFRIFEVAATGDLTLHEVTVANGHTPDSVELFDGSYGGGGIYNGGTLTLNDCTITDNSTGNAGQEADAGFGGGILNDGTLTIIGCTVSGNAAGDGGPNSLGGDGGDGGWGGGIFNGGVLTVVNSTVSGNRAGNGGPQDTTEVRGGNGGFGGGIYNNSLYGTLTLTNATITDNASGMGGPGGFSGPGGGIAGGSGTFTNTIIAGNRGLDCWSGSEPFTSGGNNLIENSECVINSATDLDIIGRPARLGPLRYNGGSTQTHALLRGSPAIDAGDEAVCAAPPVSNHDQRGSVRPGLGHGHCSIGAYEADLSPPETCAGDCDTNGSVAIDELVILVNIALSTVPVSTCTMGDRDNDGEVRIDEILTAVVEALAGCQPPATRFVDNSDGTITDLHSGLMWEKKDDRAGGLHDTDLTYPWGLCQPTAMAAEACLAEAEVFTGCQVCDGFSSSGDTIWTWLLAVNSENSGNGLAGHSDRRLPNTVELQAIVEGASSGVSGVTQANMYWSLETDRGDPSFAYGVDFATGDVRETGKPDSHCVRAVRRVPVGSAQLD